VFFQETDGNDWKCLKSVRQLSARIFAIEAMRMEVIGIASLDGTGVVMLLVRQHATQRSSLGETEAPCLGERVGGVFYPGAGRT
jgi:hypothetical protein